MDINEIHTLKIKRRKDPMYTFIGGLVIGGLVFGMVGFFMGYNFWLYAIK